MCQPGRPATPARLPRRLVGQGRLPQHEVERVALVRVVRVAPVLGRHGQHGGVVEVADVAEAREGGDVEVDGTARLVGVAGVEDGPDQGQDLGDGRGGAGLRPRGDQPEGGHVVVEAGDLLGRQVEVVDAELPGLAQDVVVDVGHVAHAAGFVAGVAQPALEHVEGQVDEGVAQVGRIVGRDPAAVHGDDRSGVEREDATAGGVVQLHQRASPANMT